MIEIPRFHWKEFPFHRIHKHICIQMLDYGGYVARKRLTDFKSTKTECSVVYDRDYVVLWLSKNVIRSLTGLSLAEVIDLITEAYKLNAEQISS